MTRHRSTSADSKIRYRPRVERLEPRMAPAFLPGVNYYTGGYPGKPDVADFNLDGNLDVAVPTCFLGQVSVLLGNGDGTLQPQTVYDLNAECTTSVETPDMNNDGVPDIATSNDGSKNVTVLLGKGDGTFRKPIVSSLPEFVYDIVARDFNGDGNIDVATVDYREDRVYVQLGNGDGTLTHVGSLVTGMNPIQIAASDFNNDGSCDLATANQFVDTMSVFLGNGDGTFQSKVDYATGGYKPNGISTADFDNDGASDIVVSNTVSNRLSIFMGLGDGTFQAPAFSRVRKGPTVPTVGDFNRDGFIDIAVACQGPQPNPAAVTVLLNDQAGGFVTHSIYTMPFTARIVSGDLNGDTFPDLISDNSSGVTVFVNDTVWSSPIPTTDSGRAEAMRVSPDEIVSGLNWFLEKHLEMDNRSVSAAELSIQRTIETVDRYSNASVANLDFEVLLIALEIAWKELRCPFASTPQGALAGNGQLFIWRIF